MRRRSFLQLPAAALAQTVAAQQSPEIAVVGAGAFGGWTALSLLERQAKVAVIDAYGPGNARSASGGLSRLVRSRHTDELDLRLVLRSFALWRSWEEKWGEKFLIPTGYLALAGPGPTPPFIADARKLLDKHGVASELLDPDEIRRRYPQIRTDDVGVGYFEPGACTARPADSCRRVFDSAMKLGARHHYAFARPGASKGRRLEGLRLSGGESITADVYVFACGPWMAKTLPDLMKDRLRTPRREAFFWGTPAGDDSFTHNRFPAWSDITERGRQNDYYGFPDFDGRGFRIVPVNDGNELDPDSDERVVSAYQLKRAHEYLAYRFPALANQPVIGSRVCQTEMTPNGAFLIDRHPELENVWIVGGGSGSGFKHGPAVGEFAADRILGREVAQDFVSRFQWREDRFPEEA